MPLFLFEAPPMNDARRDAVRRLAARRFPEISLEQGYAHHDGEGQDVWVCRAPSRERVSRWTAAAGLTVRSIRHVEPVLLGSSTRAVNKEQRDDACH
jgi:hypothetical protein